MSSGLFDLNQSTARHKLAAPEFFYSNLRIQETLTTIRYGIEKVFRNRRRKHRRERVHVHGDRAVRTRKLSRDRD